MSEAERLREDITKAKREGRETGALVARLIEIDKRPKPNKKPKINTP